MTTRQLIYFSAIYESGNILKAAETLYISTQALNRALSTFENELGMPLFIRSRKGMQPTPLGEELYRCSRSVIEEFSKLEAHMKEFIHENSSQLQVGIAAGARYFTASGVWRAFCEKHPEVSIDAKEYRYVDGLAALENNQLDLLIFSDYEADSSFDQYSLKTWKRDVLVPAGHPLYGKEYIDPRDFEGQHVVICANPMFYQHFLEFCQDNDCHPAEIIQVSDTLYMYETCSTEKYLGIAIDRYFTGAFSLQFQTVKAIPFKEEFLPYVITVIARKNHPMRHTIKSLSKFLSGYLEDK